MKNDELFDLLQSEDVKAVSEGFKDVYNAMTESLNKIEDYKDTINDSEADYIDIILAKERIYNLEKFLPMLEYQSSVLSRKLAHLKGLESSDEGYWDEFVQKQKAKKAEKNRVKNSEKGKGKGKREKA